MPFAFIGSHPRRVLIDASIFYFHSSASTLGAPGYRHRRSDMSVFAAPRLVSTAAALVDITEMINCQGKLGHQAIC